jgi:hypothetical protein
MPKVELLPENSNSATPSSDNGTPPEQGLVTFEFDLEDGGTASFRMPLVQDLIDIGIATDREENNKIARTLSELCLLNWNGSRTIPEQIDGADDSERLLIFLELLAPLVEVFDPGKEKPYIEHADRSREIILANGHSFTLRRLTVKENLVLEDGKIASTERACRIASSACIRWWKERPMMPGDLYSLTLEDYGKVFQTLRSFRYKPAGKARRRIVS